MPGLALYNRCEVRILGEGQSGGFCSPASVARVGKDTFCIEPFSEDGDPCYKFRLEAKIINKYSVPRELSIIIDWHDEKYIHYRDEVFCKHETSAWKVIDAKIEEGKTVFHRNFYPGETYLTLNPKYDYQDLIQFIGRLADNDIIKVDIIGETGHGHNVFLIKVCDKSDVNFKKNVLVTARTHPYETAGSYCIEGMIGALLENGVPFKILKEVNLFFVPMLCPDGVEQGCCKLSDVNGIDFSRNVNSASHLSNLYINLIDVIRPTFFLELHNWMLKEQDGLFYLNFMKSYRIRYLLGRSIPSHIRKPILVGLDRKIFRRQPGGLKKYAQDKYGAKVMTAEFGWHGRNVEDMREIGRILFQCLKKII